MGTPSSEPLQPRPPETALATPTALGRSHLRTQDELRLEAEPPDVGVFHKSWLFLRYQVVLWVWHYLRSRLGKRYPFLDYAGLEDDNGIYALATPDDAPVTVALAGDWASGTRDAYDVGRAIEARSPHFTIHLGDIYYVGSKKETLENMLGRGTENGKTSWPPGTVGTFSLNANHEMYALGKGYFKHLLPQLGLRDASGDQQGQKASFFCLRNDHWSVVGLDTGYHSVGFPILEKVFRPSAKLDEKLMQWLRDDLRIQDDNQRGIVLLSHHQYYSAFEPDFERAAKQLSELIHRPVLWLWGHEHRLALYGKHATRRGRIEAFGRCLGHGGLPMEDIVRPPVRTAHSAADLVVYDARVRTRLADAGIAVGYNGFATMTFEEDFLSIDYSDFFVDGDGEARERVLVRELWRAGVSGVLQGVDVSIVDPAGQLLTLFRDRPLSMAIGAE